MGDTYHLLSVLRAAVHAFPQTLHASFRYWNSHAFPSAVVILCRSPGHVSFEPSSPLVSERVKSVRFRPVGWDFLAPSCALPLPRLVLLACSLLSVRRAPSLRHQHACRQFPCRRGKACVRLQRAPRRGKRGKPWLCMSQSTGHSSRRLRGTSTGTDSRPRLSQAEPSSS